MAQKQSNTLSNRALDQLKRDHQKLKYQVDRQAAMLTQLAGLARSPSESRVLFRNNSGETIPAFAIMAVSGSNISRLEPHLTVTKPSTTVVRDYIINGELPVSAATFGYGVDRGLAQVLFDTSGDAPELGEDWGPKPGEWKLFRGYPGVSASGLAGTEGSTNTMLGHLEFPLTNYIARVSGTITGPTSTTSYVIHSGQPGSTSTTTFTPPSAYTWISLSTNQYAVLTWLGDWLLLPLQC